MSGTINDQPSRCRIVEGSIKPAGTDPTPAQLERLKRAREIAAAHLDPKIAPGTIASIEAGRMDGHVWVRIAYDALGEAALIDPDLIHEQISEGHGHWLTCTGCYETSDGQNVHGYPHSRAFGCILGSGCSECGGIGAVWDTTDFEAMGRELASEPFSRAGETEAIAEAARHFGLERKPSYRCEHCGRDQAEATIAQSESCSPPFEIRPHVFSGQHPADRAAEKTLASAGRCHCGFWPCAEHQIDDISAREEEADG